MAMDGLSLHAMLWEARGLTGARVDKVQQPDKDTLLLSCHGASCGRVKLLVNIHNENGRIALTKDTAENPAAAPAFCMLLRKRLIGSRITKMEQAALDRTVRFFFSGRDELMDETVCSLVVELMGKHGNAFLLDENDVILDCLRHIGVGAEALRVCLPNVKYESLPPQEKKDPLEASLEELTAVDSPRALMNGYMGISRQIATLVRNGTLREDEITEQTISDYLYTAGQPDVDLLIRTSGEQRLSNFMLYQNAYSEFVFPTVLWPDFTVHDYDQALDAFAHRNRRFGGR